MEERQKHFKDIMDLVQHKVDEIKKIKKAFSSVQSANKDKVNQTYVEGVKDALQKGIAKAVNLAVADKTEKNRTSD